MSSSPTLTFTISPAPFTYEACIGSSIVVQPAFFSFCHSLSRRLALFVAAPIEEYARKNLLPHLGKSTEIMILPGGEQVKSRQWKEKIEDFLSEKKYGRDSCLIALGGGVLLDLVGFVAATYCRGIPYISIPTTLIAMTDASIGGKTSVNLPLAKNFIGAFHHPLRIYIDLDFLKILPLQEYHSGFTETVKHALIKNEDLFSFLEEHLESLLYPNNSSSCLGIERKGQLLQEMLQKSCQVKKEIVEQDPFEKEGMRDLLNFGHTIGHVLEKLSGYTLRHGEAIAAGMWLEAWMAREQGVFSTRDFERLEGFFKKASFSLSPLQLLTPGLKDLFAHDKKAKGGIPYFVALRKIGDAFLTPLDEKILLKGIQHVLRCH